LSNKKILILDYSITRIEASAIQRWIPADAPITSLFIHTEESFPDDLVEIDFTHVIHSGSELSITSEAPFTKRAVAFIQGLRDKGVPQMGICYGHQLVCLALVGKHVVRKSPNGLEAGWGTVTFSETGKRLLGVHEKEVVWQYHFDEVIELPAGSELLATNDHTEIQAYINYEQKLFGTQFHPEFDVETGNDLYLRDRELLENHHYNVEELVKGGPSIDTGRILFDFFLE
jgi:GMP synthase-like glutamine amidotransferase